MTRTVNIQSYNTAEAGPEADAVGVYNTTVSPLQVYPVQRYDPEQKIGLKLKTGRGLKLRLSHGHPVLQATRNLPCLRLGPANGEVEDPTSNPELGAPGAAQALEKRWKIGAVSI